MNSSPPSNGPVLGAASYPEVSLLQLLLVMLKVGATGFGLGMVGVLQQEVVTRRAWLEQAEFADGLALANLLPGPIAVDAATYIGYRLRGWAGASICMLALVLPAFVIMLGLTIAYLHFGRMPQLHGAFKGLGAAVVALVLATSYRIGKASLKSAPQVVLGALALIAALLHANLAALVLIFGAIGACLLAPRESRP